MIESVMSFILAGAAIYYGTKNWYAIDPRQDSYRRPPNKYNNVRHKQTRRPKTWRTR